MDWEIEYEDPHVRLRIERRFEEPRLHRVVVGEPERAGAIIIPINTKNEILLVHQYRAAIDLSLWELPRGQAEPEDLSLLETAQRELLEETGIPAKSFELIGYTYPDTGTLSSKVAVVKAYCDIIEPQSQPDGEVDDQHWFSQENLKELILNGSLSDSMSLSALIMHETSTDNE